jgi:hypothetical protein
MKKIFSWILNVSFYKNFFFQFQELGLEMKVCSFVFCLIFGDLIRLGVEKILFLKALSLH